MDENYLAAQSALELSEQHLYRLARNSFEACFLSDENKERLIGELDACFASLAGLQWTPNTGQQFKLPSDIEERR